MSAAIGNRRAASRDARGQTAATPRPSTHSLTLNAAASYLGLTTEELRAWFEHGGSDGAIARLLARRPNVVVSLLTGSTAAATARPDLRSRSAA